MNTQVSIDTTRQPLVHAKDGEVFADHPKDAHRGAEWADVCTSLSIALQYGVPPAALARSLGTVPVWAIVDGQMQLVDASASPAGTIINCIIEAGQ